MESYSKRSSSDRRYRRKTQPSFRIVTNKLLRKSNWYKDKVYNKVAISAGQFQSLRSDLLLFISDKIATVNNKEFDWKKLSNNVISAQSRFHIFCLHIYEFLLRYSHIICSESRLVFWRQFFARHALIFLW